MSYAVTTITAQLLILLLTLATNKVAASSLSVSEYAVYGQAVLLSSLISAFSTSGLQNCILSADIRERVTLQVFFFFALLISILLFILNEIGFVAEYFLLDVEKYMTPYLLFSLPFFYQIFIFKQAVVINGGVRKDFVLLNVGNSVLCSAFLILTIYFEKFYLTFAFILFRPGFLGLFMFSEYIKKIDFKSLLIHFKDLFYLNKVFGYLLYGVVSTSAFYIYSAIARFVISEAYDLETVGYFYTAQRLFELLLGLSLTYYSSYYYRKISSISDLKLVASIVLKICILSLVSFLLISLLLFVFSEEIILVLFSKEQLPAVVFFNPLIVNMILGSLVYSIGFSLVAKAKKSTIIILELLYLVCFVFFTAYLGSELVVWVFPLIMLIKLICNFMLFYRVFYARKS